MYDLRVMGDFSLETFSIDQSIAQTQRADIKSGANPEIMGLKLSCINGIITKMISKERR